MCDQKQSGEQQRLVRKQEKIEKNKVFFAFPPDERTKSLVGRKLFNFDERADSA